MAKLDPRTALVVGTFDRGTLLRMTSSSSKSENAFCVHQTYYRLLKTTKDARAGQRSEGGGRGKGILTLHSISTII